ncbi:MAG: DUF1816 domain-containing protein [Cyanobacteria bacterium P01_C01_bin.118]
MQYLTRHLLGRFNKSWWLEISTFTPEALSPDCNYYFGPFKSKNEALHNQSGYVEDLEHEGSKVSYISIVHRTTPRQLTLEYPKLA